MQAGSELRQAHRTASVIAGGLITSLVMYVIVANVFRMTQASFSGMGGLPEAHLHAVRLMAWIASAAVVVAIPALRRALLRRRPDDTRATAITRLTLSSVAVGGLAELPAVTGFVLVILGGLFLDFYLLASLSLLLMLVNFPRYEAWEEWLASPAPRP